MTNKLIVGLLAVAALGTGCKKYPEGPGFSLASKKARMAQEWAIVMATVNGTDVTSALTDVFYDLAKDGTLTFKSSGPALTGNWAFSADETQVLFTSGVLVDTWTILRLKKKELKMEKIAGGDTTDYTMNPRQ